MNKQLFFKFIAYILFSVFYTCFLSAEENFILIDAHTSKVIMEMGSHTYERYSPCSTFKVVLSLMGYDAGILKDEDSPIWEFQDGYDDYLESWRTPQSPMSWMKHSSVWYSKLLSIELGLETISTYLLAFEYGNQNVSTGLVKPGPQDPLWINSSLLISPKEQVNFIQKMVLGQLNISSHAFQKTKALLFREELMNGWKLFGKTGWSGSDAVKDGKFLEFYWFVGWIEKDHHFLPFAYLIRSETINLKQGISRVKQLIKSQIM